MVSVVVSVCVCVLKEVTIIETEKNPLNIHVRYKTKIEREMMMHLLRWCKMYAIHFVRVCQYCRDKSGN